MNLNGTRAILRNFTMKSLTNTVLHLFTERVFSKNGEQNMTRREIGNFGETVVCNYLTQQGYDIVKRNYCIRGGEIDIIAIKSDFICFVEVKTRKENSMVSGLEAVTRKKHLRIIRTAERYLLESQSELQPRFDVAEVILRNNTVISVQYIKSAFCL